MAARDPQELSDGSVDLTLEFSQVTCKGVMRRPRQHFTRLSQVLARALGRTLPKMMARQGETNRCHTNLIVYLLEKDKRLLQILYSPINFP